MSFLNGIFAAAPSRYIEGESLATLDRVGLAFGSKTDSGITVSQVAALNLPSVYRAVSIISDTLGQLPAHVMQKTSKGRKPVKDHPVEHILAAEPNPHMTAFTFRQIEQSHALLWGNGTAEIQRTRGGEPIALHIMEADRTFLEEDNGGDVYRYSGRNGRQVKIDPADVMHVKALGFNGRIGYSQIALHRNALGLAFATEKFGSKFFANDAKSGGILQHPERLSGVAADNVRKSFESQGGVENANRVKVLEEGMKYIPTTIPPEDAQFLGTRQYQVEEIARMYGVPLILMQSGAGSTVWGTGIEQLLIGFVVWTMAPWVVAWEQEIERKLFTERERKLGLYIKFSLTALLRGDMAARASFYQQMFSMAAIKPNEIRELEDMNKTDEGEFFALGSGIQPLATAMQPKPDPEPGVRRVGSEEETDDAETEETEDTTP